MDHIEQQKNEQKVRFCIACGRIGEVPKTAKKCCPDGYLRTYLTPGEAYAKRAKFLQATHRVLDPCCGGRMFYFDKSDNRVLFGDQRQGTQEFSGNRILNVDPLLLVDFRKLPFDDLQFYHVVFDPPHIVRAGPWSWLAKKYGKLNKITWQEDLKQGFAECFRVLKRNGTLIFKWNEDQIPISEILKLTDYKPLYGHRSGKAAKTHWIAFLKDE